MPLAKASSLAEISSSYRRWKDNGDEEKPAKDCQHIEEMSHSLRMRKHRALLVQQKVRAELDTPAHDPAERAVVVVDGVVDEEGVVRGEGGRVEA